MNENIIIKTGEITNENVCAIVDAANSSLMGGGGVDGAIHRAGGPAILEACKKIRQTQYPDGLPTGEAVATTAGNLPAKYVIHTVGPVYHNCGNRCDSLLAAAYENSLKQAMKLGCKDVAFPAISTGIYGYPKEAAARIAYKTVKAFLSKGHDIKVYFVFHSNENKQFFEKVVGQ
ncbi:O-acetyl-ADP-ribose deacetylase 1 [Sulfurovum lithotrophicum]|uniref:O-acetyl-ADP-ribose deacetylase 1 n=1 Tax=Sulfurovum lithotrophicum TaxID=206403 RepID=A0A7U4M0V8_9BACT|nr:O-acetyl-ADP-ribose deacetylase [Sulfurovum lithotrophicum]AKF24796.1 O-acetyl-ADP-ribose deacetylase 1 [Sulfurovum lithotrophicum]